MPVVAAPLRAGHLAAQEEEEDQTARGRSTPFDPTTPTTRAPKWRTRGVAARQKAGWKGRKGLLGRVATM
eukprot:scaffold55679_cov38-Tisochrysis_lutea.AAC.2